MIKARHYTAISFVVSATGAFLVWPVVSELDTKAIQPIASGVATIAGILLGCVIAAISILVSSSHNSLIRNISLTGGLSQLIGNLNHSMLALVATCVIFLAVLFIPDSACFGGHQVNSVVVLVGVFALIMSFMLFLFSWKRFKDVASRM